MIVKAVAELSVVAILISVPSALILSRAISATLVIFASETLKLSTVVAPKSAVPVVVKVSFPKSIAPPESVILPLAKVRLPIVVPVASVEATENVVALATVIASELLVVLNVI